MWSDHLGSLGYCEPRHARADNESRDFCSAIFTRAGTREHGVEIRDPGVRDETLAAIDDVSVAVAQRGSFQRSDVGSRIRLSQSKRRNRWSVARAPEPEIAHVL